MTIEDSLAYNNGTLSNGGQAGNGDRNGYKLGGEDIAVNHIVRRSIAFDNGKHGFTYNSNPGTMTISNNLSIDNAERNFNFDGGTSVFRNNTSCNSGSNDRIIGNSDSSNQFWSGTNGSRVRHLHRRPRPGPSPPTAAGDHLRRLHHGSRRRRPRRHRRRRPARRRRPTATPTPTPRPVAGVDRRVHGPDHCGQLVGRRLLGLGDGHGRIQRHPLVEDLATLPSGGSVQGWSGTFALSGSTLTVSNAAWNGALGSGASTAYGWNGRGPRRPRRRR